MDSTDENMPTGDKNTEAVTESRLLQALKKDVAGASELKNLQDAKIGAWQREFNGEPYGNEEKGKSRIVSRDIKRQSEWQHASLVEPFVSTNKVVRCTPVTANDVAAAKQNQILLNYQFCRVFKRFNFVTKVAKVLSRQGTVVVKTGWNEETDASGKVVANHPTAEVCRHSDIYIDPSCEGDFDKSYFVAHRYNTTLSDLNKDKRYKNLDKVAKSYSEDMDYVSPDDTLFEFSDVARKKMLMTEYWGYFDLDGSGVVQPIVCSWINNTVVRIAENPYPDKKLPFLVASVNSDPFELHGEADAEYIGDNQKVKTSILRSFIDNMAAANVGQKGVKKGTLDPLNQQRFEGNKSFEFNTSMSDIYEGRFNAIPNSAFGVLDIMNNEIESMTATKSFSGGINGASLGPHATGARGAMDATSVRRMNLVRNLAENVIVPMMRKWMMYNAEFLEEEEVVRVTDEEFVPIRRDDLGGRVDIEVTVATAEDNAARSQEITFLLQTVGPNEDPAVRRMLMAENFDLLRMPDAAKALRNYEPKPDPIQQRALEAEVQKAELQNALLEASVEDKRARAEENRIDARLKTAKALEAENKAKLASVQAERARLDFVKADQGFDHLEKVELETLRNEYRLKLKKMEESINLKQLQLQKDLGDTNLGVVE